MIYSRGEGERRKFIFSFSIPQCFPVFFSSFSEPFQWQRSHSSFPGICIPDGDWPRLIVNGRGGEHHSSFSFHFFPFKTLSHLNSPLKNRFKTLFSEFLTLKIFLVQVHCVLSRLLLPFPGNQLKMRLFFRAETSDTFFNTFSPFRKYLSSSPL